MPTILGEVKRYFRDLGWSVRVPRSLQELAASIEDVIEELTGELGRTPTTNDIAHRCDVSPERVLEARAAISAHHPDSLDRPTHDDEPEPRASRLSDKEHGYRHVEHAADLDRMLAFRGCFVMRSISCATWRNPAPVIPAARRVSPTHATDC